MISASVLTFLTHFLQTHNLVGSLKEVVPYLLNDMKQPISYLIAGGAIGIGVFVLSMLVNTVLGRDPISARSWFLALFAIYLVVLVQQVLLSRAPGSRTGEINLTLFGTWGNSMQCHAYVIENILLFLPFGFLLPLSFPRMKGISNVFCLALFSSAAIEIAQYCTGRGYCQLDDLVMNTVGAIIGYIIYAIFHGIYSLTHRN